MDDLSDAELEFYSRQIVLPEIGYKGQLQLKKSRVCIVGLGGLGSPAAIQLASLGIGNLRLVDCDVVELSNLQRQILYSVNVLGYAKVEAAAKRLRELNPNINVESIPQLLSERNSVSILKGVDVVVDGLDRMSPRYALNRACQKLKIPYIFAAAIMTYGTVSTILPGKTSCLECFQGNLNDDLLPSCSVVGVHPSVLSLVASVEVSEAVKILLNQEPRLSNKLLYCDIGNLDFETINLSKVEECPVCGRFPVGTPMNLKQDFVSELCSRGGKRVFRISPVENIEVDINELSVVLRKKGFVLEVIGEYGVTFSKLPLKGSILKSGIVIVEGLNSKKESQDFYEKIFKR